MGSSVSDTGLETYLKTSLTMKSALFVLVVLAVTASALTPCPLDVTPTACPNAKAPDHDVCQCRSQELEDAAQYKCAVMYENLPNKYGNGTYELTWLGALPDALRRKSIGLLSKDNVDLIRNINIGMYYSMCGRDWQVIESEGVPLRLKEPLCCKRDARDKLFKFERCDGSPFKTSDTSSKYSRKQASTLA